MHRLHCHVNGHRLCQWTESPRRQSQARSGQVSLSCVTCSRTPHGVRPRAHKQIARSSTETFNSKVALRKQKDEQFIYKASWQIWCHISSLDCRLREQPLQKAPLAAIAIHPFLQHVPSHSTEQCRSRIRLGEALETPAHSLCSPGLPADLRPQARQASRPGAGWTGKAKTARVAAQPNIILSCIHPWL